MSTQEQMTINERYKYLRLMQPRYFKADLQERSTLPASPSGRLDEMEQVTRLHRKSLVRLLGSDLTRKPRQKQRGRTYAAEVDDALRVIAESLDYICAERLTPNLVWLAKHLAAHGELRATPQLLTQLERISISTVGRILRRIRSVPVGPDRQDEPCLPRRGPETANQVARQIPMTRIPWNETQPGHVEIDLVHHCGRSAEGEYVHTLQMIDVATGWSERVAVLGRSYVPACCRQGDGRCLALRLPAPPLSPARGAQ